MLIHERRGKNGNFESSQKDSIRTQASRLWRSLKAALANCQQLEEETICTYICINASKMNGYGHNNGCLLYNATAVQSTCYSKILLQKFKPSSAITTYNAYGYEGTLLSGNGN